MSNLFERMFGKGNKQGTGATAKSRLQFVLVHDRINLPPERMAEMKAEILAVISKYVSFDHNMVDISLEQRDRASALVADIPFKKAKEILGYGDDEELEDALPSTATQASPQDALDTGWEHTPLEEPTFVDDATFPDDDTQEHR
ncbi:cell division topological specificity factor MinE [Phototrophicus methaneseepsis]|uniref:Cell division topological specificity factor n=1 Tax=Phototrophicus methaneseepsis TaxID=2710758 RepID=A0A7S8IEA5_9CHLR|nr:cell division topological specificity factor MinE [Phototrophicus methaneseepsis]QPC81628.1 cell division topological specificity factor MinE [Phototrophicus methaneseepsis]